MTQIGSRSPDGDALVRRHLGLARRLARRYARPGGEPLEDLAQVAALGLVKAAQRFDPDRGIAFSSYAVPTILGELRRHLRTTRWPAHVPRPVQENALRLANQERSFSAAHGRAPSAAEAAAELGWSLEDLLEARLAAQSRTPLSIDEPRRSDGDDPSAALHERIGEPDPGYERAELRDAVEQALTRVDAPSATAFRLRTEAELTLAEVAERMHVSPSRASLLCRRAADHLRAELTPAA